MKFNIRKYSLALLAFVFLSLLIFQTANAQNYRVAIGWRAGSMTNGIALKVIPKQGLAIEGTLNLYPYGSAIGATVQSSHSLFCIRALQIYGGVGAHYRWNYFAGEFYDPINGNFAVVPPPGNRGVGLDAVAGVELKIPLLPIAISAEVKPNVEFTDLGNVFYGLDPGVGIKVAF
ncbi:MAG: hypothetical protein AAGN35_04480 [Bacteroidota bacterium]